MERLCPHLCADYDSCFVYLFGLCASIVLTLLFVEGKSLNGLNLAQSSRVLSLEGKDQVGDEKKQSARRRTVPQSNTISPNDPECKDAEGKS
ncbi:hypothetical protein H5410_040751 [Solanum commersonii]|uniref:Uncharacterized protein n=1 Tax=Solanum commersonii TaxID=4109 RepID=A0A9J5XR19_SOLCO|nr:hypothetical protein H5410_040751 [Solanum commersonii]